jgi:hypothetical protein
MIAIVIVLILAVMVLIQSSVNFLLSIFPMNKIALISVFIFFPSITYCHKIFIIVI